MGFRQRFLSSSQVSDWTSKQIVIPSKDVSVLIAIPGLAMWHDAADLATYTYGTGAAVSQWADKSGNGRHFLQPTAALQPQANGSQNGRTTLVFDGTDDYMDTAAFTLPQPFTALMACDLNSSDITQGWWSSVGGNLQTFAGGGYPVMYAGNTIQNASLQFGGVHQWAFEYNGGSSRLFKDGAVGVTGDPGTAGTTTGIRLSERGLAAGYRFTGKLFEVCVYDRVLTDAERQTVENYLRNKWGLT